MKKTRASQDTTTRRSRRTSTSTSSVGPSSDMNASRKSSVSAEPSVPVTSRNGSLANAAVGTCTDTANLRESATPRAPVTVLLQGYRKDSEDCRGQLNAYVTCIDNEKASLEEVKQELQRKEADWRANLALQWRVVESKQMMFEADCSRADKLGGFRQRKARKVADSQCDISGGEFRKALATYKQTLATNKTLANTEKEHIEQSKARIAALRQKHTELHAKYASLEAKIAPASS